MFTQPKSWPEFRPDGSDHDLIRIFEEHVLSGLPADLALDLVLNELVARAAKAAHATAAAVALLRNNEMVCRAATGEQAPDLGAPLSTRHGLSGACAATRKPQISADTESDPRLDPAVARQLGIRSILVVPVFDADDRTKFTGVLEVFSPHPGAFSCDEQTLVEGFAEECARLHQAAFEPSPRKSSGLSVVPELVVPGVAAPATVAPEPVASDPVAAESVPENAPASEPARYHVEPLAFAAASPPPASRSRYETWTVVLGGLTILAIVLVSFLIGSRIGWLRLAASPTVTVAKSTVAQVSPPAPCVATAGHPCPGKQSSQAAARNRASERASAKVSEKVFRPSSPASPTPTADELVVYENGKVVFRMKPSVPTTGSAKNNHANAASSGDATAQASSSTADASSAVKLPTKGAAFPIVWISPTAADALLVSRTEPEYPAAARAAHRSGDVVLEVEVGADGSVANIRTLSGDPQLAAAAAEAVRNWRYRPYRQDDQPIQFQTDVTLGFVLPN